MSSLSAGIIHKPAVGVTSKQCIQADTQLSRFTDITLLKKKQNPNKQNAFQKKDRSSQETERGGEYKR